MGKPNGSPRRIMVKIVQRLRKRMDRQSQKMKTQDQKWKMEILTPKKLLRKNSRS